MESYIVCKSCGKKVSSNFSCCQKCGKELPLVKQKVWQSAQRNWQEKDPGEKIGSICLMIFCGVFGGFFLITEIMSGDLFYSVVMGLFVISFWIIAVFFGIWGKSGSK